MDVQGDIEYIVDSGDDQKDRTDAYKVLVEKIFENGEMDDFVTFVNHMLAEEEMPLVIARQVFLHFANHMVSLNPGLQMEVGNYTLDRVSNRAISFEEPVAIIREHLGTLLESEGNYEEAAQMLALIPLESGVRVLDANYKIRMNVTIANLYLKQANPKAAELYINKAAGLLPEKHERKWSLEYKAAYTKIQDYNQRYIEASRNYYSLAQEKDLVASQEQFLKSAVVSGILAPAGPQRSRMLALLYKFEATQNLDKELVDMLENMYLGRILRSPAVEQFRGHLEEYQSNTDSNGTTDLERAVIEHNLLSCASLYCNISFSELGKLLGIEPMVAEDIAARMIGESRMTATIDQIDELLVFENDEQLSEWDTVIAELCQSVDDVYETIHG